MRKRLLEYELDDGEGKVETVCYGSNAGYGCRWSASLSRMRSIRMEGGQEYRFTPPSSGLTITAFETVRFSLIHLRVLGSAYCTSLASPGASLAMARVVMTNQIIDRH